MRIKAVVSSKLSTLYNSRYIIIDEDTGDILDDAQGYGYKSTQKAYAAYSYLTRDKSKDAEKAAQVKHIKEWMKEHKEFVSLMNTFAFEIAKGSWGPDDKFDSKLVAEMLKEWDLKPDFTPSQLLKVWRNYR